MNDFIQHINLKHKQFICTQAGFDANSLKKLTVKLENKLYPPVTVIELEQAKRNEQFSQQFLDFYGVHNGLMLYCHHDNSAIEFFALKDIENHTVQLRTELTELFSEEDTEIFDFMKEGISFGKISFSTNYFWLYKGKVYTTEPAIPILNYKPGVSWYRGPFGTGFFAFLSSIANNPATFLNEMGGYTRYYDDQTTKQWIPREFIGTSN